MRQSVFTAIVTLTFACMTFSQQSTQPTSSSEMSSPNMSNHSASSGMKDMPGMDADTSAPAMQSMEGHHMDMGPHMKMTTLRALKAGDEERAQIVVAAARQVSERYKDYRTALADGFKIFLPNVPQKMYHFTNYKYAFEAAFTFNPEHPTSLLYEKQGDGYKLVGVMYTAPRRYNENDLDRRIPLSIAQWHEHVNLCMPPADRKPEALGPKFGLHGSIATQADCDANGGTFRPIVFNWMVHLYPLEKTEAEIWDVARGAGHNHAD